MTSSGSNGGGRSAGVDAPGEALHSQLSRLAAHSEASSADLEALFAQLQRAVGAERGPRARLRALPTWLRVGLVLAVAGALGALAAGRFMRPDITAYPAGRMALALISIGALLAASLWLALRPLQLASVAPWVPATAALGSLLWLGALYLLPPVHEATGWSRNPAGLGPTLARALPCMVIGLGLSLPFLLLLRALDRGGTRRPLLMAAAAGLLANFVLQLACPVTAPVHMLLGHMGVAVLLLAGAAALGGGQP